MQVIQSRRLLLLVITLVLVFVVVFVATINTTQPLHKKDPGSSLNGSFIWEPPDTSLIPFIKDGELIRYGRELIANTAYYLGPKGKITAMSNGMNCQNCHLDAGTRSWGNNYSAVFSTYPKFRERSGAIEDVYKRVNDCFERSLNGQTLDTNSHEMRAIYAYIKWLGEKVPKGIAPSGAGISNIVLLERAADPTEGRIVYADKCQRCHGGNGQGIANMDGATYLYPPLWGDNSYNTGAGLYRLSRFAGYVKNNMPFDAASTGVRLTDEEAWDVAAFVNSQPRPEKDYTMDWPDKSRKPFDHPFGPYTDGFSEEQHKFGPFEPVREAAEKTAKEKSR